MSFDINDISSVIRAFSGIEKEAQAFKLKSSINNPYMLTTIEGIEKLFQNKEKIADISDETERRHYITNITSLTAEPGFCPGSKKDAVLKDIQDKVNLLVSSYFFAKDHDTKEKFFVEAFQSDPCFNGRIDKLTEYHGINDCGIDKNCFYSENVNPQIAMIFYDALEQYQSEKNALPASSSEFACYLKSQACYQNKYQEYVESSHFSEYYSTAKQAIDI